jgi:hypothetical protein
VKIRRPKSEGRKKSEVRRCDPLGFGLRTLCLLAAVGVQAATNESGIEEEIPPLRPFRPEVAPTVWEQYGVWIVLAGVLLLVVLAGVVWLLTRPKPPVIVAPAVQARHELEPLRQQPENGFVLSRVSQVLRHYVAGAFDLPREELTTAEFCRAITGSERAGPELSVGMSDFLRECDRRKFAPLPPVPPLGAVAQADKLIEQAEARRAQLLQAAAAASAGAHGEALARRNSERPATPK